MKLLIIQCSPPSYNFIPLRSEYEPGYAVGIATGYGLDDQGADVPSPGGEQEFSLLCVVQTGSGAHSAYPMGTGGSLPEGKAAGARS
jgi:hypothetical protein